MNIVKFFSEVAALWEAGQKCGYCWAFGAPLSESGLNDTRLTEGTQCCVQLFVTDYEVTTGYGFNSLTGLANRKTCDHAFTLFAVRPTDLGTNTFSEIPGHPIEESLWKTVLEPLQNCLGCGNELELCELGYDFDILQWKMKAVRFKEDQNYSGWRIAGLFRENITFF